MTKTILTLITLATILSCSKNSSSDDNNQQNSTKHLQISNGFYDSVSITVENKTTPSLSMGATKLSPNNTQGFFMDVTAKSGDQLLIKGIVIPNKKWGRHPLFLSSLSYDTTITVGSEDIIRYTAPASRFVQLRVMTGQQMKSQYVRGTIKYGTTEDSLFYASPNELTSYQTIGYFKTSDVQGIDKPVVTLYYGQNKPYTIKETTTLWSKTGIDAVGSSVPLAPSITAPKENTGIYQYTAN